VLKCRVVARIYRERLELPDDLRRLISAIAEADAAGAAAALTAGFIPPLDVLETDAAVEVFADLPGVPASEIQIVFARNVLLIAGHKVPAANSRGEAAFHLAERGFGRFRRAVRLEGGFDGGRAEASLAAGELRVVLPRIEERRGREISIPIRV
jgi:HSP20 family protein